MSVLPEDVNISLTQLVGGLSSADNALRSKAEKILETEWSSKADVEVLLVFLAEQASMPDSSMNAFCAVLFRRIAIKSPKEISSVTDRTIGIISEPPKKQIRSILLRGFISQQNNYLRHKISDAISEVAKIDASPSGTWNELLPTLFESTSNTDPSFRESAFRVFATVPELIDKSYMNDVMMVFNNGFVDSNDDVRIAACIAFVAFFRELPKKSWQALAPLLPNLLNSLPGFLEKGQGQALTSILEALIDLIELAPKMFMNMFPTIIEFCTAVCKDKDLESGARMTSLELLTTFSESSPNMCKRASSYVPGIIIITLSMLTEVCIDDDDAAEWNNKDDTEEENEEPEYDAARQALDRVCLKLNGQVVAPSLFQYLPAMLRSADWRERQAALMALSSAAEGCCDVLIDEIPRILDMVLPLLVDDHPRVQYACCNALGQMSTDFADIIQKTCGSRILPALISKLTNQSVFRVQAHAAAALVNFSEAASKEVLEPYLDDLLNNLLILLQSPKRYVQEQVLTTIAIIADAAEKKFIRYYDTLMPMLTDVLRTDMGNENRLLKAKCIECSTLIALAVGKEKFLPHSQSLIQLFGHIQETCVDDDDPVKQYLEQGWGRICRILGKDFIVYLPAVLPPLLQTAKATQDISLLEEEEAEEYNNNDEWDVINLSGKHIAVHSAALDDKVSAMDLLRVYAVQLKEEFFPWVKEIVEEIALPALDFYLHDGVRVSACLTLVALLKCTVFATSRISPETLQLFSRISDKLFDVLMNEPVPELLVAYYTAIVESIGILGPNSLSEAQLQSLGASVNTNLIQIYKRIENRDDGDDEYAEELEQDEELTDEELLDEINKTISAVFKNSKSSFLNAFQELLPTISTFLNDENKDIRLCGLCVISDLLENCSNESIAFKDIFMGPVGESLTSSHASIRQAASYAVGMAAQHGPKEYANFCLTCLEPILKMATLLDAHTDDNIHATETSVATIAKILHCYGGAVPNLDNIILQWLELLPIVDDEEAAPFAYIFLTQLIENQHSSVMSHIPHVVDVVIQALSHLSITGNTAERTVLATKHLLGTIPHAEAMGLLQRYGSEMPTVQRWFS